MANGKDTRISHFNSCLEFRKVFNVLLSRIGREAYWPNEENWNIYLKAEVSLYFIGRENGSTVLS